MHLKEYRKSKNKKQKDIANVLNIARSTYNGYEQKTSEPSIDTLKKLADYYNISLDELIGRQYKTTLSEQDKELLEIGKQLNEMEKAKVIGYAKARLEEQKQQAEQKQKFKTFNFD